VPGFAAGDLHAGDVDRAGEGIEAIAADRAFQRERSVGAGHGDAEVEAGVGEGDVRGEVDVEGVGVRLGRGGGTRRGADVLRRRGLDDELGQLEADRAGELDAVDDAGER